MNNPKIAGAIFEGKYEGLMRVRTMTEWMAIFGHNTRARVALIGARDGEETSFKGSTGEVWNLRLA